MSNNLTTIQEQFLAVPSNCFCILKLEGALNKKKIVTERQFFHCTLLHYILINSSHCIPVNLNKNIIFFLYLPNDN